VVALGVFFLTKVFPFFGLAFLADVFDLADRDPSVERLAELLFLRAVRFEGLVVFEEVFPAMRRSIQYDFS